MSFRRTLILYLFPNPHAARMRSIGPQTDGRMASAIAHPPLHLNPDNSKHWLIPVQSAQHNLRIYTRHLCYIAWKYRKSGHGLYRM